MKARDLDELKSTTGYWFTHEGGARHAESSYYYMSPTHHSTALGFQFKLHQLQDNQNQQLLRDWISFRLESLTFVEVFVVMDDFKVILGLEFFRETKTSVMPSTGPLAMLGNKPMHYPSSFCGRRVSQPYRRRKGWNVGNVPSWTGRTGDWRVIRDLTEAREAGLGRFGGCHAWWAP